jgi:hypothetical protein
MYVNDRRNRYTGFGAIHWNFAKKIITGRIPNYNTMDSDFIYATGASDNHFDCSLTCILSIVAADPISSFVYIDYGIEQNQLKELGLLLSKIIQIKQSKGIQSIVAYRKFNFNNVPTWIHINNTNDKGAYSWKVIAIHDVASEWNGNIGWIDAGAVLTTNALIYEKYYVHKEGFFSPISGGGRSDKWIHPGTTKFLEEHKRIQNGIPIIELCSGGYVFFNYSNPSIRRMIDIYYSCSLTKKCIAPYGSSRMNHRQDQAVLSLLTYDKKLQYTSRGRVKHSAVFHVDGLYSFVKRNVRKYYMEHILSYNANVYDNNSICNLLQNGTKKILFFAMPSTSEDLFLQLAQTLLYALDNSIQMKCNLICYISTLVILPNSYWFNTKNCLSRLKFKGCTSIFHFII